MAQAKNQSNKEVENTEHKRDIVQMQEFINEYDDSNRYSPPEGPAEGARDTADLEIRLARTAPDRGFLVPPTDAHATLDGGSTNVDTDDMKEIKTG